MGRRPTCDLGTAKSFLSAVLDLTYESKATFSPHELFMIALTVFLLLIRCVNSGMIHPRSQSIKQYCYLNFCKLFFLLFPVLNAATCATPRKDEERLNQRLIGWKACVALGV